MMYFWKKNRKRPIVSADFFVQHFTYSIDRRPRQWGDIFPSACLQNLSAVQESMMMFPFRASSYNTNIVYLRLFVGNDDWLLF